MMELSKDRIYGLVIIAIILSTLAGGILLFDWSGDGMQAYEDISHGTNPLSEDTVGNGLTDYEEVHVYGTDPTVEDTTGDGLTDAENVEHGADPTLDDTTGDGLSDYDEIHEYGTDPSTEDTTGDGLTDYDEIYEYGTDPTVNDTNDDGLTDAENVEHGADPLTEDTTGDGLTDYDEIHEYGTDPSTEDTTGDGLSDYDEIHEYGTDPSTEDTTGDGLSDYDEIHEYGTDPTTTDTTGDGLSDYDEVHEYGTDPSTEDTTGDGLTDYMQVHDRNNEFDPTVNDTNEDGVPDAVYHEYGAIQDAVSTTDAVARYGDDAHEEILEGGDDQLTRETLLNDTDVYEHFGLLLSEDYDVMEHDEIADKFDFIHTEKPVGPGDSQPHTFTDTTNDGFSDTLSEENEYLSTEQKDVLIHLEVQDGEEIPISMLLNIHMEFQEAPIEYDHSDATGINLQFYISDVTRDKPPEEIGTSDSERIDYITNSYESVSTYGYGYHSLVMANESLNGGLNGFVIHRNTVDYFLGGVVSTDQHVTTQVGSTLMHEIGHMVSLEKDAFEGIDGLAYDFDEYPSVMSYRSVCTNYTFECYGFSDEDGAFDDWGHIKENYREFAPSTDNL